MVALHTEAPPRVPGDSLRGKRPHDYGPGRICAILGCGTTLRRTHKGLVCDPCIYEAKARARTTAREVLTPAATTAAPAARTTKEGKVTKESLREGPKTKMLMVFARDPTRCFSAEDVVKSCGVSPSCAYYNLKALVASGDLVKDAPGEYHWPKIEGVKTALASPPAPAAPVIPPLERAAESAPASDPPGNEPRMPVPFAGLDYELHVIGALVSQIESLSGHETRIRVAAYVAARFLP